MSYGFPSMLEVFKFSSKAETEHLIESYKREILGLQRQFLEFVTRDQITKIAGGQYARLGDFPYMVVVHQIIGNGNAIQCGGTILSKRWVLTAAHCAEKYPRRFLIVFGIVNKYGISYDTYQGPGRSMIATQAFIHPHYSQGLNDIALIRMPHDIPFSKTVQPINLAYENSENFDDKSAFAIGWGKYHTNSGVSTRLQYAALPIIKNTVCRQFWYQVTEKEVCTAPGLGRNACQGDSGGPLVVVENGMDIQIGIVSYGDAYCPSNMPGVFTRVSSYISWIYGIIMKFDTDYIF
ncbi:Chymotrypsin-like protease CTRL-1 [Atta colombica]|uniref:Chymotrypsin-like protease CTRL-1 n=1 Tax=Atta colombica TaxID=520822 RepID=A0A195BFW7_9HYME|nr:Chymotrypsin-like protease CTRL-1 [Atta colombica]